MLELEVLAPAVLVVLTAAMLELALELAFVLALVFATVLAAVDVLAVTTEIFVEVLCIEEIKVGPPVCSK